MNLKNKRLHPPFLLIVRRGVSERLVLEYSAARDGNILALESRSTGFFSSQFLMFSVDKNDTKPTDRKLKSVQAKNFLSG